MISRDENRAAERQPTQGRHLSHYSLEVFGYEIAQREGYKAVSGIDAVHFYIVHKFNWLPATVRSMSHEDLWFLLAEEMHQWPALQQQ